MALTYALEHIESKDLAEITNYGQYLEFHPPTHEVEIFENTSWSCIHGIERWRSDAFGEKRPSTILRVHRHTELPLKLETKILLE